MKIIHERKHRISLIADLWFNKNYVLRGKNSIHLKISKTKQKIVRYLSWLCTCMTSSRLIILLDAFTCSSVCVGGGGIHVLEGNFSWFLFLRKGPWCISPSPLEINWFCNKFENIRLVWTLCLRILKCRLIG